MKDLVASIQQLSTSRQAVASAASASSPGSGGKAAGRGWNPTRLSTPPAQRIPQDGLTHVLELTGLESEAQQQRVSRGTGGGGGGSSAVGGPGYVTPMALRREARLR